MLIYYFLNSFMVVNLSSGAFDYVDLFFWVFFTVPFLVGLINIGSKTFSRINKKQNSIDWFLFSFLTDGADIRINFFDKKKNPPNSHMNFDFKILCVVVFIRRWWKLLLHKNIYVPTKITRSNSEKRCKKNTRNHSFFNVLIYKAVFIWKTIN